LYNERTEFASVFCHYIYIHLQIRRRIRSVSAILPIEMKSELDSMVDDMQKSLRKQNEEFQQDMKWELKGMRNDDPHHDFKTDVREMKKDFRQDVEDIQEHIKNTVDILTDKMDIKIELLKDRTDVELSAAIGEIIQQAKKSDVTVE